MNCKCPKFLNSALTKRGSKMSFPTRLINQGIKVELEHTKYKCIARCIATAHLAEDRKYYTKLRKAGL